ncbi:hypothetical protein pb186bvf_013614 [Paramecium bursaria]
MIHSKLSLVLLRFSFLCSPPHDKKIFNINLMKNFQRVIAQINKIIYVHKKIKLNIQISYIGNNYKIYFRILITYTEKYEDYSNFDYFVIELFIITIQEYLASYRLMTRNFYPSTHN